MPGVGFGANLQCNEGPEFICNPNSMLVSSFSGFLYTLNTQQLLEFCKYGPRRRYGSGNNIWHQHIGHPPLSHSLMLLITTRPCICPKNVHHLELGGDNKVNQEAAILHQLEGHGAGRGGSHGRLGSKTLRGARPSKGLEKCPGAHEPAPVWFLSWAYTSSNLL